MTTSLFSRRLFSAGGSGGLRFPSLRLFSTSPTPDANSFPTPDDDTASREQQRAYEPRLLEGGMDPGVYKAVLIGKVGQAPVQRTLRSGLEIVLFSLATGGIKNNRRPLPHERPDDYEERCAAQWHRVCVYDRRIAPAAMRIVQPGAVMYVEGNIETKVFVDPTTGIVRRIREIAVRLGGRLLHLSSDNKGPKLDDARARAVGYF